MGPSRRRKEISKEAHWTDRRRKVADLKIQGRSFREIGKLLGINDKTVAADWEACMNLIRSNLKTDLEGYRAVELERLDVATRAIADRVMNAAEVRDDDALKLWIKITESRSKLLGLNAPEERKVAGFLHVTNTGEGQRGLLGEAIPIEVFNAATIYELEKLGLIEIKVQPREVISAPVDGR